MELSTNQTYYRLRRGTQVHKERKHDRHTTWLECGLKRLTHILIKENDVTWNTMCTRCFLGLSKREFDKMRFDRLMEEMEPYLMKEMIKNAIEELELIQIEDDYYDT